jgi:tetratricopeptide (TPR) repeat protein/mono/diheme cytochrome c family protein
MGLAGRVGAVLLATASAARAQDVTFTRDIAPIVFTSCVSCHRAGGPGPFPLTTYQDVRRRAQQIARVTRSRFMPPWKVEPEVGPFMGQHPLTEDQMARIDRWVRAGTPEGNPKDLPPLPADTAGWVLGKPDLVVTLDPPYTLPALPTDEFRIFAIPIPVNARTYVRGIEFHPGNPRVVHHANLRIDRTGEARRRDAADPRPGYDGLMPRSAVYPDGHFLGWTPGQIAPLVSPDLAWTLEPGSDLAVQLHLQPSGAPELVKPEIGLYFSRERPARTPTILRLGSQGIDIAPGDSHYVIRDSYTLPADAELLAIQPHAHYRAKQILGTATFPGGRSRVVMHIKDWDFRWQHVYRLETPLALPKGTRLAMEYTYDNSAENVRNPVLPPAHVYWGQRSKDEMGDLWFQLLVKDDREHTLVNADIQRKMTAEDIIGYETMLTVDPRDSELHDDVALLYLALGRAADAVGHFRASVELTGGTAASYFNLGTGLTMTGRLDEAVAAFREALARRPDYSQAHANLGRVLLAQGKTQEAVTHLEAAVRFDPRNAQAYFGLSEAYAATGAYEKAVEMTDRALDLQPAEPLASQIRARRALYQQRRRP